MTTQTPSTSPAGSGDVLDRRDRTPLRALASAYADRLADIGAGAGLDELMPAAERIAVLERQCVLQLAASRRQPIARDPADYLG